MKKSIQLCTFAAYLLSIVDISKGSYVYYHNAECSTREDGFIAGTMIHALEDSEEIVINGYHGVCKYYEPSSLSLREGHCIRYGDIPL